MWRKLGFLRRIGTREEVFLGQAMMTSGGLRREDLTLNGRGRVVSLRASEAAKKRYPHRDDLNKKKLTPIAE